MMESMIYEVNDLTFSYPSTRRKVLDSISSAQSSLMDMGDGGASSSTLLWSIIATLIALAFCFYLVHAYRHRMAQPKLEATPSN